MTRGISKLYEWNGSQRTILEILSDGRVQALVGGPNWYAMVERLRRRLTSGKLTYKDVVGVTPRPPSKMFHGRVINPKRKAIYIRGQKVSAQRLLERFPTIREYISKEKNFSDTTVVNKIRKLNREGKLPLDQILSDRISYVGEQRTADGTVKVFRIENSDKQRTPEEFLTSCKRVVVSILRIHRQNKVNFDLNVTMINQKWDKGQSQIELRHENFRTSPRILNGSTDIETVCDQMADKLLV